MKLALVGGTGREGKGLAPRWAKAGHEVFIGSRKQEKGERVAAELNEAHGLTMRGGDNAWAVSQADTVVVTVPYKAHQATLEGLADDLKGKVVIDITVPLRPPKVREVHLPEGTSAALEANQVLGEDVALAAALHHISSEHLGDADHTFDCDVLVASDHQHATAAAIELIGNLGMRGLDAGPLRNAIALESLTPVLLYMNKRYKASGTGLKITGLPE